MDERQLTKQQLFEAWQRDNPHMLPAVFWEMVSREGVFNERLNRLRQSLRDARYFPNTPYQVAENLTMEVWQQDTNCNNRVILEISTFPPSTLRLYRMKGHTFNRDGWDLAEKGF